MKQPKVAIIIINWNGKHLLEECLSSAENQDYSNYKIIFVDNGSKDKSVEFVKEKFPEIEVISLGKNTGFAKANNVGIHKAFEDPEIEYVALLNNDAMTEKSWLSEMVEVIKQDNKIGSVAPKILKYFRRDIIDSMGDMIHLDGTGISNRANEVNNEHYNKIAEVFGISGCSCLYSRKMLEDIQVDSDFFDSDFFLYLEDVDLNWRARLKGWKCFVIPNAIVYHKHSETTKLYSPLKAFYVNRNRYFVIIKNYSLFLLPKAIFYLFYRYFYSIKSIKKDSGSSARLVEKSGFSEIIKIVIKGWIDVLKYAPRMIKKRFYIQKNKKISNKEIKKIIKKYEVDLKKVTYSEHIK
ncbi:MAG: glycosyltransferase family 2 protein [Patescibacteria group bacterium]|nr:glycosyltransferase family 2 protein [Patescibacteria group bacterium]